MRYKLAYAIVWCQRLFLKKGTPKHYELTFVLEDIIDEAYHAHICELMNRTWNNA